MNENPKLFHDMRNARWAISQAIEKINVVVYD